MEQKMRWGIIGCGAVTERKSGPAYQQVAGFQLQAVMRRDLVKAKDYAKRHNVPSYYNDADALINDPNVDAIYIATPPDSHEFYALKVAQAGKPCCIEKPMAPSYKACVNINHAFEVRNIPLFVAYYRRSLPRFEKIKQWLNNDLIGEVRNIHYTYTRTPSPLDLSDTYDWHTDIKIAYAGYFDDLASHALDIFTYLLGPVQTANGFVANQQGLYTSMDAVVGNWLHKNGIMGAGSWNFGSDQKRDRVEIIGSKGHIKFGVFGDDPIELYTAEGLISETLPNPDPIQLFHVKNMAKTLFENTTHVSTGVTAAHTAWIMDAIMRG